MRNVVCPHCQQTIAAPDDLEVAHCVRCGRAIAVETGITVDPAPIAPTARADSSSVSESRLKSARRGADPTWDEFRASSPTVQHELLQLVSRSLPDLRGMAPAPLPTDIPTNVEAWGEPLGSIVIPADSPANRSLRTLSFLGGGLIAAVLGILWLFDPPRELRDGSTPALMVVGGVGALVIGAFLHATGWSLLSDATLWVFDEGVLLHRGVRWEVAAWDHVEELEVSFGTGRPLYWLTLSRNFSVTISEGFSRDVLPLMEYVELRLASAQFLRRLEAIWHGRPQRFGDVTLDCCGFQAPRFYAAWADVRNVVSDAQTVFVTFARTQIAQQLRYRDVSFPYLVMAISHVMIDEHERFPKH